MSARKGGAAAGVESRERRYPAALTAWVIAVLRESREREEPVPEEKAS